MLAEAYRQISKKLKIQKATSIMVEDVVGCVIPTTALFMDGLGQQRWMSCFRPDIWWVNPFHHYCLNQILSSTCNFLIYFDHFCDHLHMKCYTKTSLHMIYHHLFTTLLLGFKAVSVFKL